MTNEPKTTKKSVGFTDEEKAAARERVKEMKANLNKEEAEKAVLAKIAGFPEPDRSMAKRIHAIAKTAAPRLSSKLWYGMPAYANENGDIFFFFKNASKFKMRYSELGFSDHARLDEGSMWPDSYALKKLTATEEAKIAALVKKAVS